MKLTTLNELHSQHQPLLEKTCISSTVLQTYMCKLHRCDAFCGKWRQAWYVLPEGAVMLKHVRVK